MVNLTHKQTQELREKLLRCIRGRFQPVIYPNGFFEIHNISESDAQYLSNILRKQDFIATININKSSKINFSKWNFNNGYAQPGTLFNIKGLFKLDENINEKVEIHNTLNPKIWDENNELLEEVEDKIYDIVDEFKNQLAEDGVELSIKDIYLLGSNANYNYTDTSDLDIHIMVDESFDCDEKHLQIIYNAYKSLFNSKYDININGINVELYVENIDDMTNVSTGIYSIKKGWIKEPSQYAIPQLDEDKFEKAVAEWEKRYLIIKKNPSVTAIDAYIDDLYNMRKESIKTEGEFSFDNLLFKEIRRLKYLENLKKIRLDLKNKELSLE